MILLGVNIDHAATLRQARYRLSGRTMTANIEPDPIELAFRCEKAGADGITVHMREDRRHIQREDVLLLGASDTTRLNLEMASTPAMMEFALHVKPHSVCLVPESREEITTEGGLDIVQNYEKVQRVTEAMNAAGIKTSLFIDPEPRQIELAAKLKATWIELHTGAYANAYHSPYRSAEFQRLCTGANLAHSAGLVVNGGHGINYVNIEEIRTIPHLHELNIGHSIMSRALFNGIDEAVTTMKRLMNP